MSIYKLLSACPTSPPFLPPDSKRVVVPKRFFSSISCYYHLFAVITQHHSTHLSCYPIFFSVCENQKFIYWVGSLYTHFHFKKKKNKYLHWIRIFGSYVSSHTYFMFGYTRHNISNKQKKHFRVLPKCGVCEFISNV